MEQNDILQDILDLNREMEERQEKIKALVIQNRKLKDEEKDKDFTDSIESYYD